MKTMIEWHKGKPAKSGSYLVVLSFGGFRDEVYSAKHDAWNASDNMETAEFAFNDEDVIAWADYQRAEQKVLEWAKDDNTGD